MRASIATALLASAATVFAMPQGSWSAWGGPNGHGGQQCLNDTGVQSLIDGYTYLLEKPGGPDYNSTALAILSDKFVVYSDSINTLSQRPLGAPSFPSLQAFIAAGSVTPPLPNVATLSYFYNCAQIAWRWNATGVQAQAPVAHPLPVLGIILFDVNATALKIDTVYSEFNTAAFEYDLGNPECKQQ